MASKHVGSIHIKCKRKKRGYYAFVNGKSVWTEYPDDQKHLGQRNKRPKVLADQFGTYDLLNTAPEVTRSKPKPKDYVDKMKEVSSQWATLQQQLVAQLVQDAYPTAFDCCRCQVPIGTSMEDMLRCLDCGPKAHFCKDCFQLHHSVILFHKPEKWNPKHRCFEEFKSSTTIHRPDNHTCNTSRSTPLVIIDDKGRQHCQAVQVCKCQPIPVIMLQYGLWAGSPVNPRVAFTLDFMLTLRAVVLEGQISLRAFCSAMQQCRNGMNSSKKKEQIKDIYRVIDWQTVLNFMSVYHDYSHLQFAGIGFPDGTTCQVCPEEADGEGRRLAMDGNMNLVHRAKAGHSVREPLHKGRFFLCQNDVDNFLDEQKQFTRQKNNKTCSNFQVSSLIRSKNKTEKLDFTGTFASVCSHDYPCSIFNMRYGERMAYPIFMLKSLENVKIMLYDIGCQLETTLKNRNIMSQVMLGVPIFHVFGHNMSCQLSYSPRCLPEAGLFDGEGTERLWSYFGNFKIITKEMTPENRTDLLTEALLNYGDKLTFKMAESLSRRLAKAYMLKKSTGKTMNDDLLLLPGVTLSKVDSWGEEEKATAFEREQKRLDCWEEEYALKLQEYYSRGDEVAADDEPDDELTYLEVSLAKLEKKWKVKRRWERASRQYQKHLLGACNERRYMRLSQVRDAVVQYNFMMWAKKEYASGQAKAKRITIQVIAASKKVNNALQEYNEVPPYGDNLPHRLQRSEVAALDAGIWMNLAPVTGDDAVPHLLKRKLIDTTRLNKRAAEEITIVLNDMGRLVRSLNRQQTKVTSELQRLDKKACLSMLEKGSMALLVQRLLDIFACQKSVTFILGKAASSGSVSVQEFVDAVESQLIRDTQPEIAELPDVSKESLQDMIDDIAELEEENSQDDEEVEEEDSS